MSEFHWLSLLCGVLVLDCPPHSWDTYHTPEMCILITSLANSKKCSVFTLNMYCLPLKGNLDGEVGRQLCWSFLGENEGERCLAKSHLVIPKSSTSARLLQKIPYSLVLVQQHVVNLLWQVFTIPFVCFLRIFRRIMFDERDSVPNPCANMHLCQMYLHGDLES